jgi:hypothetical protein
LIFLVIHGVSSCSGVSREKEHMTAPSNTSQLNETPGASAPAATTPPVKNLRRLTFSIVLMPFLLPLI